MQKWISPNANEVFLERMETGDKNTMEKELISIIIPIYNVELFLEDCVKSIIDQIYDHIEIILIDDGSTDRSGKLCDEFGRKDSRIRVIHQENQGLSGARNTGLTAAKGIYVSFIDSDDFVDPMYIDTLYQALMRTEAEVAICDYVRIPENERYDSQSKKNINKKIDPICFGNLEAIKEVYNNRYHGMTFMACGSLCKKSLFIQNCISFPYGKIHEDTFTTYKLYYYANKVCYINNIMYFYRKRKGSIMNSGFSEKSLVKFDAIREEMTFYSDNGHPELMRLAFFNYLHEKKLTLKSMLKDKAIERAYIKRFAKSIRKDLESYSRYIDIPLKKMVIYTAMSYAPDISRIEDKKRCEK